MITLKRISKVPSFMVAMAITRGFRKSGKEVNDKIRKELSSGSRSGRVYIIRGRAHTASAAGEYPAKLSGRLVNEQSYRLANKTLIFGNGAPYSTYLEKGTGKMESRAFLKPLVEQNANDIEKNLVEEITKVLTR